MEGAHRRLTLIALLVAFLVAACAPLSRSPVSPPLAEPAVSSSPPSTQFRGDPARTGRMPSAELSRSPALIWSLDAGGSLHTSAAVIWPRLVVTTTTGEVIGLDAASGSALWRIDTGEGRLSSPAVFGANIVFGSHAAVVHSLTVTTGQEAWATTLDASVVGAPAVSEFGVVVATARGTAALLDADSGRIIWTRDLGGGVDRSPALNDRIAVFPVQPGQLVAVELATGDVLWRAPLAPTGGVSTPAIDGALVYAALGLDAAEPGDRAVVAVDLDDGQLIWRFESPAGARVYTPALASGLAIVVGEDGNVAGLDCLTGDVRWTVSAAGPIEALPVVIEDVIVFATNGGTVEGLAIGDGLRLWTQPIEGVPYSPTAAKDMLFVTTELGTLYAFGPPG